MGNASIFLLITTLFIFSKKILCSTDRNDLYCGACKIIAEEINWDISQVDPRKTLEVESFRIDSHGNQRSKKVQYARSETHLVEILEKVCERMNNYAESTDKETGRKKYIRTSSRTGEAVTLENISMSGDIAKALKFACESVIEDYEDTIVDIFKQEREDTAEEFCQRQTDLCANDTDEARDEL
ncbi:protein canopy homolog 2-like [Dendronephthya gigantea]|uniref:protein canopy homolog 2-like n=1 Tax=Dendronephthya gigantea TaxID=151771 RepID=UPI00106D5674|nr:protein canopy homolog 2-like [Dendronephthya gigantea]XP_028391107.1 protein canopy homolog 2-like [Dendronephthya gigantea]